MEKQYNPHVLVIFDYSGTLSVEAPAFGRPEILASALAESGLFSCGVTSPDIFWERIVFPTWDKAGRSGIGFAQSMADRIAEFALPIPLPPKKLNPSSPEWAPLPAAGEPPPAAIAEAAERFVSMYLAHSRPEPLWRPFLEKLHADPALAVLIATDHYAEATAAIVRHLGVWGIPAVPLKNDASTTGTKRDAGRDKKPPPVCVANSADLGFWKAERPFWETVRKSLPYHFHHIVLMDDFGFNEADVTGYGMLSRVRERRINTRNVLKDVFQTGVSVLPFLMQRGKTSRRDDLAGRIQHATEKIEEILKKTIKQE